ncbi:MAG: cyclase family protein [Rhodopila sp.]|nr:cyclase family protein [Rhodopila sp.]
MQIFDISRLIIPGAVAYPGDSRTGQATVCDIGPGCPCRITALTGWTTHFLTHFDAPRHFIRDGKTLDQIPLHRFMCEAVVVEATGDSVTPDDVDRAGDISGKAVLFKTRNSLLPTVGAFDENHVFIAAEAAERAVAARANVLGIDYLSVDRHGDEAYPVHMVLLGADVLILEGLDLSSVPAGAYRLVALPLKINDADGSPVRAVLLSN